MDKQRLIYLITKQQQGACSPVEKAELYELMQDPAIETDILQLWDQLHDARTLTVSADDSERIYKQILADPEVDAIVRGRSSSRAKKQLLSKLQKASAIAAALAIFFSAYFIIFQPATDETALLELSAADDEVLPGSRKAKIVFADGTQQVLGDKSGATKLDGSNFFTIDERNEGVSYLESSNVNTHTTELHTLITPIGGEYAIQLADGTKVWLNANSKLIYPVSFHGASARAVEVEGEAYFDVAKVEVDGRRMPFIVKSKGQSLEVLGTEFNVNTFRNNITTTLVEGSVRLSFDDGTNARSYTLKPNDQSSYDSQSKQANIVQLDTYYVTAWKNGDFAFDNAPLENVMEDIARWYDVSVDYKSDVNDVRLSGKVSKFESIETLLQTIEWTGSVKLELSGRKISVTKKM